MSTDLFGSKFSAKIGESSCRMPTRAFDIFQTIRHFWVFPGFFPALFNIFALQFFLLISVRPLIFLPNSLDLLLSLEVLMVFNDSCVSRRQVRQGNIFLKK